eukprot:1971679-Rhodomonas_salina.1
MQQDECAGEFMRRETQSKGTCSKPNANSMRSVFRFGEPNANSMWPVLLVCRTQLQQHGMRFKQLGLHFRLAAAPDMVCTFVSQQHPTLPARL